MGGVAITSGPIRYFHGNWIKGFTHNLGSCSVPKAEVWVVLQGLELAWKQGFRKVVIETDSKLVHDLIISKIRPSHPLFSLVMQCQCSLGRN